MFTIELLQAINNWQKNGYGVDKELLGERIVQLAINLPKEYRTFSGCCYRKFNSVGKTTLKLGLSEFVNESFSSWSTNLSVVKEFGKKPNSKQIGLIFKLDSSKNKFDVILNLDCLYKNKEFVAFSELNKDYVIDYNLGIGKYGNIQEEIILKDNNLTIDNIIAYFGKGADKKTFTKKYLPHLIESDKQIILNLLNNKFPNMGTSQWVENPESLRRIIEFNKIGSILLSI